MGVVYPWSLLSFGSLLLFWSIGVVNWLLLVNSLSCVEYLICCWLLVVVSIVVTGSELLLRLRKLSKELLTYLLLQHEKQKGILSQEEWKKKIKAKIEKKKDTPRYRDIQFSE